MYILMHMNGHIKIHAKYMQDTCKIHGIRILITTPPNFDNKPPDNPWVGAVRTVPPMNEMR